jgi:hypothetical protein
MESAKNSLQVIDLSTDIGGIDNQNHNPAAHIQPKLHPPETQNSATVVKVSDPDLNVAPDIGKKVKKAQLINKLNYINFRDGTILINFKHLKYDKVVTLEAAPNPCVGDLVDCLWSEGQNVAPVLQTYRFSSILISNGSKLIKVKPELVRADNEGISLLLPELAYEISSRRGKRHSCEGINVQLIQNSTVFFGTLQDFNGFSFRVHLKAVPPQTFDWMNPEHPVNVMLSSQEETFYTGECRIIRHTNGQDSRNYILEPLKQEIQRFKHKEYRSERYELTPSPNIVFQHPFTGKRVDLKVVDLSGSGFSVEEDVNDTALLPGLIIPELELNFAGSFRIKCSVQVVFRKSMVTGGGKKWNKCGLALLDMDIQDHLRLIALLHQTKNKNSYICNNIDLDALWDFFFETGFIYPDKYAAIQKNKKQIKETYAKLYTRTPQIARHFIYQDKGVIHGHMAMLRFYNRAWMIHHHAARKSSLNKAGLIVLDQIGRMGNDSHRLRSLHMDYMICYYRPDNKFPSRVFGGAAKAIKDPKGCSVDGFAYFHVNRPASSPELPEGWKISETGVEDLRQLSDLYEYTSGGLMLDAIDLTPDKINCDSLSQDYQDAGLTRRRELFSLNKNGRLKAIFMVNHSDVGLNLSDITSCVKVFVIDSDDLDADLLNNAITRVAEITDKTDFPTLLYPAAYADEQEIEYEKIYNLWVVSLQRTDEYFRYLDRLLRFV